MVMMAKGLACIISQSYAGPSLGPLSARMPVTHYSYTTKGWFVNTRVRIYHTDKCVERTFITVCIQPTSRIRSLCARSPGPRFDPQPERCRVADLGPKPEHFAGVQTDRIHARGGRRRHLTEFADHLLR